MYLCVIVSNSTKQTRINLWLLFISANRRPLGLYRGTSNTSNLAARPAVEPLGPWEGSTMWDQDSARFNPSFIGDFLVQHVRTSPWSSLPDCQCQHLRPQKKKKLKKIWKSKRSNLSIWNIQHLASGNLT